MDLVDELFKCIQGKNTVLVEQDTYFGNMASSLKYMANITSPLNGVNLLTVVSEGEVVASTLGSDETYVVTYSSIQSFLKNVHWHPEMMLTHCVLKNAKVYMK